MIANIQQTIADPREPAEVIVEQHSRAWYAVTFGGQPGVQLLGDPDALLETLRDAADKVERLMAQR